MIEALKGLLANFLNAVKEWFQEIILFLLEWLLSAVVTLAKWFFSIIEMVLDLVWGMVASLGWSTAWSGLPVTVIDFLYMIDLKQIAAILLGAIIVRVVLNLIPTWATRV